MADQKHDFDLDKAKEFLRLADTEVYPLLHTLPTNWSKVVHALAKGIGAAVQTIERLESELAVSRDVQRFAAQEIDAIARHVGVPADFDPNDPVSERVRRKHTSLLRELTKEMRERDEAMAKVPSASVVATIRRVFETDENPAIFEIDEYQSWLARVDATHDATERRGYVHATTPPGPRHAKPIIHSEWTEENEEAARLDFAVDAPAQGVPCRCSIEGDGDPECTLCNGTGKDDSHG